VAQRAIVMVLEAVYGSSGMSYGVLLRLLPTDEPAQGFSGATAGVPKCPGISCLARVSWPLT
jgi:hypothetical protein